MIKTNAAPGARTSRSPRPLVLALSAVLMLGSTGCTDWAGYDLDSFWGTIPVLSTMRHSVAYDPYEMPRLPAAHSVPFENPNGDLPGRFEQTQIDSVAATLHSPILLTDPAVLARGEVVFEAQCSACHGPAGAGDGSIIGPGKFPFAPAINSAASAARSDGYIYAVIDVGRGLMPPYGEKIAHLDRWAVVAYVRHLEEQAGSASTAPAAPVAQTDAAAR